MQAITHSPYRPLRILGICGSQRSRSLNRMLLELAGECLPAGAALQVCDWSAIPPFDADAQALPAPDSVRQLREQIRRADGVVIATPEYNFSVPGMLKNALDWVSRGQDQPLARKPLAILSASPGPLGGARVQYELRKILLFMDASVLVRPEVFVGQATHKFDDRGQCTDSATRGFVQAQMDAFTRLIAQHRHLQGHQHDTAIP